MQDVKQQSYAESTGDPAWLQPGASKHRQQKQNRQIGLHESNTLCRVREAAKSKETVHRVTEKNCKPLCTKGWVLKIHKELRHLKQVKLWKEPEQTLFKTRQWARPAWLMPVILATGKAEVKRIRVWDQSKMLIRLCLQQKKRRMVMHTWHPRYCGKLKIENHVLTGLGKKWEPISKITRAEWAGDMPWV
jgi:hypothetical protein